MKFIIILRYVLIFFKSHVKTVLMHTVVFFLMNSLNN